MIILVMGVSGSGKTTIGSRLAERLHWSFYDADTFHPAANIDKMRQGIPLSDVDRLPWLMALQQAITGWLRTHTNAVLACSALKSEYRQMLCLSPQVKPVYLKGSFEFIQQRLQQRQGHYMKADLLQSQFDTLEEPEDALQIDITQPPEAIVADIRKALMV
ncbi:MAG: gluconokinase [Lyngbya sp. HA4199-MV5]|jgi:gluconokinase|nr:gluconokinase [Lyngbya sp. HA4199-MV5]